MSTKAKKENILIKILVPTISAVLTILIFRWIGVDNTGRDLNEPKSESIKTNSRDTMVIIHEKPPDQDNWESPNKSKIETPLENKRVQDNAITQKTPKEKYETTEKENFTQVETKKEKIKEEDKMISTKYCVYSERGALIPYYIADVNNMQPEGHLESGTEIVKIRESSDKNLWRVRFPDGNTGWISQEKIKLCN